MRLGSLSPSFIAGALLLVPAATPEAAVSKAQTCEAAIELAAAKYAQCRLKAESKLTRTGDDAAMARALASCSSKLSAAYDLAFRRWSGSCPTVEPAGLFDAHLAQCTSEAAVAAAGGSFPACGDGAVNAPGEQCDGADLSDTTCASLGFPGGDLGCTEACAFDTTACAAGSLCGNGVVDAPEQCDGDDLGGAGCASLGYTRGGTLGCGAGCGYDTTGCASQALPATGQARCWTVNGFQIPCPGSQQDGDDQAGATLAYTDNGNGTVTDDNTGLMWEKLSDNGSIHDIDNVYTWTNAFWVKLAALNDAAFAGYSDWRVPNVKELQSIVDYENVIPAASPAFNDGCFPGCNGISCSCTRWDFAYYWSSTSHSGVRSNAWIVDFGDGGQYAQPKSATNPMRAVRGGS